MNLEETLSTVLKNREKKGRLRSLTKSDGLVDFSSNDYLSLSENSTLKGFFQEELKFCNYRLGNGGSRLLDGNNNYIESVESYIGEFYNSPSCLLFNSGFDANVSIFSCIPQPGDCIIYDELIHASVHDGMRLSRNTKRCAFEHNSLQSLRQRLTEADTGKNVFIAVESVYSMDGDVAPLGEIVKLVKSFKELKTYIIVDEAHATGTIGPNGKGLVSECQVENDIFIRLCTFGKALCATGAVVLCSPITREYLINYSRPLIFSTALSFPCLAAIKASYRFFGTVEFTVLQSKLWGLIRYFDSLHNPNNPSQSSIIGVICPDPRRLSLLCRNNGILVRPIVYPTVPKGKERVRVCIHAGNTTEQIDKLISILHSLYSQNSRL